MFTAPWPLTMAFLTSSLLSTEAAQVSFHEFDRLARDCAPSVDSTTLAAIAKVESGFDPLAAHDNTTGETLHWDDQTQARHSVRDRLDAHHSIDVGLMQINSNNFSALNLTIENALQPCKSLAAAAYLLESRYAGGETAVAKQIALRRAISAYNTGDLQTGFVNGYVRKVEAAAQEILPRLVEVPQAADEKQNPDETWDVWGSYEQMHSQEDSARLPKLQKGALP
ncbi:transglycosylase family protein [Rhizobium leguminosarum bv. trifolii WSM2297]|uniref:Transglycosylase family protein n=1 Tax=Rhizobium leguminosarum bv. trifolii WSM2297 TaxID=754762 RepID=J0CC94_RHILT|nr:type IV secretion system lytic transglycosylase VirB1 [Rhizobium leguminosarum]EJC80762.1 transglycosylase family protein [Rhizobium leguminosarum bv. trifolii WSM2297]